MSALTELSNAPRHSRRGLAAIICVFALAAAASTRARIDRQAQPQVDFGPIVYVTSGETLRHLSLGYSGLLADVYWTRAVQYFGRQRLAGQTRFDLLEPLLRVATALDPQLLIAYRFGAIFLAEKPPGGAGRPDEALALIHRGIVANPSYWRLWQDMGFIYYWDLKDYAHAALAFKAGSQVPGADVWMKTMAATVSAQGGELETSRLLWVEVYRQAGNESIRKSAAEHLAAIKAASEIDELEGALARFQQHAGHRASAWVDLAGAGLLKSAPTDPTGVPYAIEPDGKVSLGARSTIDLRLAR